MNYLTAFLFIVIMSILFLVFIKLIYYFKSKNYKKSKCSITEIYRAYFDGNLKSNNKDYFHITKQDTVTGNISIGCLVLSDLPVKVFTGYNDDLKVTEDTSKTLAVKELRILLSKTHVIRRTKIHNQLLEDFIDKFRNNYQIKVEEAAVYVDEFMLNFEKKITLQNLYISHVENLDYLNI